MLTVARRLRMVPAGAVARHRYAPTSGRRPACRRADTCCSTSVPSTRTRRRWPSVTMGTPSCSHVTTTSAVPLVAQCSRARPPRTTTTSAGCSVKTTPGASWPAAPPATQHTRRSHSRLDVHARTISHKL